AAGAGAPPAAGAGAAAPATGGFVAGAGAGAPAPAGRRFFFACGFACGAAAAVTVLVIMARRPVSADRYESTPSQGAMAAGGVAVTETTSHPRAAVVLSGCSVDCEVRRSVRGDGSPRPRRMFPVPGRQVLRFGHDLPAGVTPVADSGHGSFMPDAECNVGRTGPDTRIRECVLGGSRTVFGGAHP
ncbi:MAG: hypothetical protein JWL76_242, partial [Thermoleophilia bacterium]|nr:hypothetical protein [Thermoleophilia bacterium]